MKEYIVTKYINDPDGNTIGEQRFIIPQETVNEIRADERRKVLDLIDTMDFDFGYYYDFTDQIKEMIRTMICDSEIFDLDKHNKEIYSKTIDEFVSELKKHKEFIFDGCVSIWGIDEIAEQMKEQK